MEMPNKETRRPCPLAAHEWFYVGGRYVERGDGTDAESVMVGQMYVERFAPAEQKHDTPVVMIHGGGQTGTNFVATPDGRPGWLHDFLHAGYEVYVIDQPERGRSGRALANGATAKSNRSSTLRIEQRFTANAKHALWPQARHQTQWPGEGVQGDAVFDQFFASQVEQIDDASEIDLLNRNAGAALLDRIGDAILLTHSQSGTFGWLIADERPSKVKAILSIEPNGPPFRMMRELGAPDWFEYEKELSRPWGITRTPMQYDPPVNDAAELTPVLSPPPDHPELIAGYLPSCEPRRLSNLVGVPILIVTSQASYHAVYDHCTSDFLNWAGVDHDFVRLADRGIVGNGHMVMLEKNSHEIAQLLLEWLTENAPS
jgi:pimeloyl-ACP methyl ester carboxylesterase